MDLMTSARAWCNSCHDCTVNGKQELNNLTRTYKKVWVGMIWPGKENKSLSWPAVTREKQSFLGAHLIML